MTTLHTISLAVAAGLTGVLLIGCATSRAPNHPVVITGWTGNFHTVQLQASPHGSDPLDDPTHYRIVRMTADSQPLTVKSGLRAGDFIPKPLYNPKKIVRVIEGSDERFMIIEEAPPNDCWPYKNYILVTSHKNGGMDYKYLKVPEVPFEGIPPNPPLDPSTVLSLRGTALTFRYANGITSTRDLDDIPTGTEPSPHG